MEKLALTLPGGYQINPPGGVPSGGLKPAGENIFSAFLNLFFIIAIALAIIFIVWGGIRWTMSGGDPKAVEAARKQITYAVIGLIISLIAVFIVNTVGDFFDTQLLFTD